ncbi:MAG: cell division protein FtsA [Candidatus Nealsonbacteria bacterium RIFCSPHIGHO2_01_FULL_43_31]|uniref:Cell division protein FtsA n=2 Tax=Candidatus Nealsoniibacteriota TaxID=1817911 RepID=A0A1G2E7C8_9BACT|nr:MAG: Cell division protein ftsA [Parcubacteria group bacterium GW2011_GWB1_43_6]OGZ20686.1 MAG: cell division protein FtsA [Candidatus Nealsonbacteria bacterium RIFCSPHIGHO2_01_FULL_43_31]OGZ21774.1 MAG: cell division protein FtsA [Candidatus Nealsonbacteria bacterium RIFCSPHIGHO2_02_FULL_43_13]OGZ25581.1 MAG: cell division protein FtsA [Candidatus Nealsonbacteria bacterium RIFCSPLOWO2_01_FULL_43_36]
MAKNRLITGLDIGTHSIKALSVGQKSNSQVPEVLGLVELPSFGVRRGVVFNTDSVSEKIVQALNQLQENIGQKIEDIYVNIGGSHIFSALSRGTIIVSRADRKISEEDVNRAVQAAKTFPVPSNNEILEVFPKEFVIDGHGKIKNPCEMEGVRLEAEVLALCAFSPYKSNLTSAVLSANLQIADIIPSAIASSRAVLTPQQKELGVCLLDIGAGTTDFAVFQEGDLVYASVFPVGSAHITYDLAVGLKVDIELAEQIKKEFGTCLYKGGGKKEKIETENGETLVFSQKALVEIIESRMGDIFDLVRQELKKISPSCSLPAGVVLTGGGAKLAKIVEFAKKELKLPVRLGFPQNLEGLERDPSLSTVCGLVLAGAEGGGVDSPFFRTGLPAKIKKILKIFIPS